MKFGINFKVRATDTADAIIECVENLRLSLSDLRGHNVCVQSFV